jgi:drug/metabolite transporter (DMT)-like permease
MTNDPFQIAIFILLIAGIPLIIWVPRRITGLLASEEEARVPEPLRLLANQKYLEAVYEGEIIPKKGHRWKVFVAGTGLVLPTVMLCSATTENLIPRLLVVFAGVIVFLGGIAVLEWLVRPRGQ